MIALFIIAVLIFAFCMLPYVRKPWRVVTESRQHDNVVGVYIMKRWRLDTSYGSWVGGVHADDADFETNLKAIKEKAESQVKVLSQHSSIFKLR